MNPRPHSGHVYSCRIVKRHYCFDFVRIGRSRFNASFTYQNKTFPHTQACATNTREYIKQCACARAHENIYSRNYHVMRSAPSFTQNIRLEHLHMRMVAPMKREFHACETDAMDANDREKNTPGLNQKHYTISLAERCLKTCAGSMQLDRY